MKGAGKRRGGSASPFRTRPPLLPTSTLATPHQADANSSVFFQNFNRQTSSSFSNSLDAAQTSVTRRRNPENVTPVGRRPRSDHVLTPRRHTTDFNTALYTQGNAMKVFVRVRPYSQREIAQNPAAHSTVRICLDNPSVLSVLDLNRDYRPLATYNFTRCFWSVFERSVSDVESNRVMNGLRNTVDAYLNNSGAGARRLRRTASRSQNIDAAGDAAYAGAGSNATVTEANVSHPPYASQAEVYQHVGYPILQNTIDGYNGCVFAYGQTGSGKTFTMLGYAPDATDIRRRRESIAVDGHRSSDMAHSHDKGGVSDENQQAVLTSRSALFDQLLSSSQTTPMNTDDGIDVVDKNGMDPNELQGIIPRIASDLFKLLKAKREQDPSCSYRVEISYYEIYQDKVYDLVRPQKNANLKIRHHPSSGPYVDGLFHKVVMTEEDVARIIRRGMQERHTAATKFNDRSSRSHAILTFDIVQLFLDGSDNPNKMQSKLNLVDLAGSERSGQAGVDRPEYEEGIKINQSLTVLGRVIDCLADLSQNKSLSVPVPYRDSKLTLLLMDSIGGNSQTAMVATISPHQINYEEMRQTIRYASRAKQIMNRAVINEDPQVQQIKLLTAEIERLRQLLKEAGAHEFTHDYVKGCEAQLKELKKLISKKDRIVVELRAELERAGIADPTVLEDFSAVSSPSLKVADDVLAKDILKRKLDEAHANLLSAQTSLEQHRKASQSELVVCRKQIACQQKEIAQLRADMSQRCRAHLVIELVVRHLSLAMNLVRDKEACLFGAYGVMLCKTQAKACSTIQILRSECDQRVAALQRAQQEELQEQAGCFQEKLREMAEEGMRQQQLLLNKHKVALLELKQNRETYEEDHRRTETEKEELRRQAHELHLKTREQYRQELERLRARFDECTRETQSNDDEQLQLTASQAREFERLRSELESLRRTQKIEAARWKSQLEREEFRRQSELLEKDRQRRQVDAEVSELRRQLMRLEAVKNQMECRYEEQIRVLSKQQDDIINISSSVLADWEDKSSSMEADMCKLRALVYDQGYMNFRQKMRDMAFTERMDLDKEIREVDEKQKRDADKVSEIVKKAKQAYEEQNKSLQCYKQEMQHHLGSCSIFGAPLISQQESVPCSENPLFHVR